MDSCPRASDHFLGAIIGLLLAVIVVVLMTLWAIDTVIRSLFQLLGA